MEVYEKRRKLRKVAIEENSNKISMHLIKLCKRMYVSCKNLLLKCPEILIERL